MVVAAACKNLAVCRIGAALTRIGPIAGIVFFLSLILSSPFVSAQEESAGSPGPSPLVQQLTDPQITGQVFTLRLLHLTKDELADLARGWLEITRTSVKLAAETNIAVSTAEGSVAQALRSDLEKKMRQRNRLLRKLDLILDEWSAKGASEDAVAEYRNYGLAVLRTEARLTDFRTLLNIAWQWVIARDGGLSLVFWLCVLIGSLFLLNVLALVLAATFKRSLSRRKGLSTLLRDFLSKTAYWIIFAVGAAFVLSSMGFNLTPLMAAFGGASFIIGFATQSTLSNLASGLLLMVNRPFDVGDKVNVAGVAGTVESVSAISTVIRDAESRITIVPNKKVWDSVIINEGRPEPA